MKLTTSVLFSLLTASLSLASPLQKTSQQTTFSPISTVEHPVDVKILSALQTYADPVEALLALRPGLAEHLATPRLLEVDGEAARWLTEGDKMRLRREGKGFVDLTEVGLMGNELVIAKPNLPDLTHQSKIRPLFPGVSIEKMRDVLTHMTSFYSRYYYSSFGEQSARWLHDHIAEIIAASPFQSYISLSYHTHKFPQPTIIARFEPAVLNASLPLTILGAHQDSANYLFPLLPAPGADDDCSGTVSILEAFRVLARSGYIPENGPVEFHWYAAEEAGLLGSLDRAVYAKAQHQVVGAMMEFDMTAYISRNATEESIGFITTLADKDLTDWCLKLAKEYISIPAAAYELDPQGYPAAFAAEGDPAHNGFPGDFEPYVHTEGDRMDIDDARGVFSIEHMARFSELAIAFVVEQAGWSTKHTRTDDNTKFLWM